jgi:hypothetical protein
MTSLLRPRTPTLRPEESVELKAFLASIGMTVDELVDLKNLASAAAKLKDSKDDKEQAKEEEVSMVGSSGPIIYNPAMVPMGSALYNPGQALLGSNPTLGSQSPASQSACVFAHPGLALASRAIKLHSAEDKRLEELLVSGEDIDYAVFFSKIFTKALLHKMQTNMKAKLIKK